MRWTSPLALLSQTIILLYRYTLSALIGRQCRYHPTCSEFAYEAIGRFGFWAGGWMALARLSRCRPGKPHGIDNVPSDLPKKAEWYCPWNYGQW